MKHEFKFIMLLVTFLIIGPLAGPYAKTIFKQDSTQQK